MIDTDVAFWSQSLKRIFDVGKLFGGVKFFSSEYNHSVPTVMIEDTDDGFSNPQRRLLGASKRRILCFVGNLRIRTFLKNKKVLFYLAMR